MDTVMLVDDEPDIIDALRELILLEVPNCNVITAGSAEEALEMLKDQQPSVIVSDYLMPGLNGIEFLTEVKQRHDGIPTILLTAYNERKQAVDAARLGIVKRFFMKPPDIEALIAGVSELMHPDNVSA